MDAMRLNLLLTDESVVRYTILLHEPRDAVDVPLRNTLADVDADAVVAADCRRKRFEPSDI